MKGSRESILSGSYQTRFKDIVLVDSATNTLNQNFDLGTDRKATSAGYISCVSAVNGTTPTTTNLNYVLLYQNVPSSGGVVSFVPKKIIGLTDTNPSTDPTTPNDTQSFAVTDYSRVQFVPMAFVNRKIGAYQQTQCGKYKEDQLVWTEGLSGGFGINPNSGTNQPEFFAGLALSLNKLMIHPGVQFGRTESLTGKYVLNTPFPAMVAPATVPLNWSYRPGFAIGFSVRLAPY